MVTSENHIEPRLVANFDQVWSVHYEPPRSVLHKDESQLGQLFDQVCSKRSVQKIIEQMEAYLGVQHSSAGSSKPKKGVCQHVTLNAAGSMNPVDYSRNPRTCTTLSWRDGDLERAWITLAPGAMPQPQEAEIMFLKQTLLIFIQKSADRIFLNSHVPALLANNTHIYIHIVTCIYAVDLSAAALQ